jgi:hypothetical protein
MVLTLILTFVHLYALVSGTLLSEFWFVGYTERSELRHPYFFYKPLVLKIIAIIVLRE